MAVLALSEADPTKAGGKAGALSVLARAGIAVPDGFVIPADEYRRHLAQGPAARLAAESDHVRSTSLAPDLLTGIDRGLGCLFGSPDGGYVAVRSSATSEDTAEASAAGQHDSILAVCGTEAVAAAVQQCWASLWSTRARAYRQEEKGQQGGPSAAPAMAVLVQRFVDADTSGVLFTGEPRVIEATPGLGDQLVSGQITPDRWSIDQTGITARPGSISHRSERLGAQIVRRQLPAAGGRMCLTDNEVRRLDDVGRRIDGILGGPSDIEWAIDGGHIHILQARPITAALPRTPAPTPPQSDASSPVWRGIAASPGRATGTVRLVRRPADMVHVKPGDILVCRTTDPAWTPLFRVAAGIVTETGGLLSHAAIVARECGIPAVVAVPEATTTLKPGAVVTIDGDTGSISVGRSSTAR